MSSVSSASASNVENNFTKMIKDFKKALSVRKTPGKLNYLNKMIVCIVLVFITFTSIEYDLKMQVMTTIIHEGEHSLATAKRNILFHLLNSNIRTLINIGNNLEDNYYEGDLSKIDRFQYLS
jgi:hypothetical protein